MGVVKNGQFLSSYKGQVIDALLAAMASANPLPSGMDWVAFIDDVEAAQAAAEAAQTGAETAATNAGAAATLSQSWARGGTGARIGEDTNNAMYWAQQAFEAASQVLNIIEDEVTGTDYRLIISNGCLMLEEV